MSLSVLSASLFRWNSQKPCFDAFISLASLVHDQVVPILTANLLDSAPQLRLTALKALLQINPTHLPASSELVVAVLVARYDKEEENKSLAEKWVCRVMWHSCDPVEVHCTCTFQIMWAKFETEDRGRHDHMCTLRNLIYSGNNAKSG